jgi:hypothetical protein
MGISKNASFTVTARYKDFEKSASMFSKLASNAKAAAKTVTKGTNYYENLARPVTKRTRDIEAMQAVSTRTQRTMAKIASVGRLAFVAIASIGAYFGIDKIAASFTALFDSIVAVQTAAIKVGASAEYLSVFRSAVSALGDDADKAQNALQNLADLNLRARSGDAVARKILSVTGSAPKLIEKLDDVKGENTFYDAMMKVVSGLTAIKNPIERNSKALLIFGDDVLAITKKFNQPEQFNKQARLAMNMKMPTDTEIDTMRFATIQFNILATEFRNAFIKFAVQAADIVGSALDNLRVNLVGEGGSWVDAVVKLVTVIINSLKFLYNGVLDIVAGVLRIEVAINRAAFLLVDTIQSMTLSLLKIVKFFVIPPLDIQIGGFIKDLEDVFSKMLKFLDKNIDAARVRADEKEKIIEKFKVPIDFQKNQKDDGRPLRIIEANGLNAFLDMQKLDREFKLIIVQMKVLTEQARKMIEQDVTPREAFAQSARQAYAVQNLLPTGTFLRTMARAISDLEQRSGSTTLGLPQAFRFNSVDTETMIAQSQQERDLRSRDPMTRIANALEAAKFTEEEQLNALNGLNTLGNLILRSLGVP